MAPLLALAGFMGSGKSTVGSAVAQRLGWRFVDLDVELECCLGVGIAGYFETEGETAFRRMESEALRRVLDGAAGNPLVLALGGGTLECQGNREAIKGSGGLVFLRVGTEQAWARVEGSDRPLGQDRTAFANLLAERNNTYQEAADWVIPVDGRRVDDIALELEALVECSGSVWPGLWGQRLAETERSSLIVGGEYALEFLAAKTQQCRESGAGLHVVSDSNVMDSWGQRVLSLLGVAGPSEVYVLEPGEQSKRVEVVGGCWEWLAGRSARRDDVVVALGGGVVGDLAGFAAATYHRGIGLWQIPTSLVAQVDSSVGGKNAVNLTRAKNLVGAFYQADLVVIDPATLKTLPAREFTGALGEVVKHALLASEAELLFLESQTPGIVAREAHVMSGLVKRNVRFKASVVEEDERESGMRAVLNLGHTAAHALESTLGYGAISHGQAVALGLLVALAVSEETLGLDTSVRMRTKELLEALGLETSIKLPSVDRVLAAAGRDKKVKSGSSGFVGLRTVGEPVWGLDVSGKLLAAALGAIAL